MRRTIGPFTWSRTAETRPRVRHTTSVRARPPRCDVDAPATSNTHGSPARSSATRLTATPVRRTRRLRPVMVNPASTSASSASFFAPFTGSASALASAAVPSSATRRRAMSTYIGVEVVADVPAAQAGCGDERRAASHERIEHEVVVVGVERDELLGQLDRERRRVPDPPGALGRRSPTRRGSAP